MPTPSPPQTPTNPMLVDLFVSSRWTPPAIANSILQSLPSPTPTPPPPITHRIALAAFLRRLDSHLSDPTSLLSPLTLSAIEQIHHYHHSSRPNPLAPKALLAVASHLTCTSPEFSVGCAEHFTDRIGRILQHPDAVGLTSEDMRRVAANFEAAASGAQWQRDMLVGHWSQVGNVVEVLREYVESEWELLARMVAPVLGELEELVAGENAVGSWEAAGPAGRGKLRAVVGKSRANEILQQLDPSTTVVDPIPTPDVKKVADALKASCADLDTLVKDPLPDAVQTAEELLSKRVEELLNIGGRQHSFMDRNRTAHTFEFEDSIEPDSDDPDGPSKKPSLVSPKRGIVSPLDVAKGKMFTRRRKIKKWTTVEEDTLRKAVGVHGTSWTEISLAYSNILQDRTACDIKDKWRNMTKYE